MAEEMEKGDCLHEEKKVLKNHTDSTDTPVANHDSFIDESYVNIIGEKDSSEITSTIIGQSPESNEFACLKKDDLLKFAKDPFWVRLRIVLLVLFALAWVCMLAAAIAIIVVAPKCAPQPKLDWWQKAVIYHVHPQSFMDSNGDGFGDIKGIQQKIDYLKDLHVTAVCIGPMNPTPNFNYGYNIANHNTSCPHHYGKVTELENLAGSLHKKGMKLLLDFIPNHTSRRHKWFQSSVNGTVPYKDYYIWHDGINGQNGTKQPPNNWLSVYGESAWTFHADRQQFYYHTFSEDEPDLNLRNKDVVADLDASLRLWLSRGVDGFRFYGAQYLVESANFTDEPLSGIGVTPSEYDSLRHTHTAFQPESYDLVAHWRKVLDDFSNDDGKAKSSYYPRLMIVEVNGTAEETVAFSAKNANGLPGAHIATNKALLKINPGCNAQCTYDLVTEWYEVAKDKDIWSNWQLGNVDSSRVATRISKDENININLLNVLMLTLPGTSLVYYGEELGMKDIKVDTEACKTVSILDSKCHLVNRAPMQWTDEPFAGFTQSNKTWLPVNEDYHSVNIKAQKAHGSGVSPLVVFTNVSALRQEPSFLWGKFYPKTVANVFFFIRQAEGFPGFLVALNFGPKPSTVDFISAANDDKDQFSLPKVGKVVATTGYFEGPTRQDAFSLNVEVKMANVFLKQGEGIVLQWNADELPSP